MPSCLCGNCSIPYLDLESAEGHEYCYQGPVFEFHLSFCKVIVAMSIVEDIMKQVGVTQDQAEGGLGLIFKLAKEKLGPEFSQVAQVVPNVNQLIGKAPADEAAGEEAGGGLMGMLGGIADKLGVGGLGKLVELVAGFKKLGLDAETLQKYVKVVMTFIESKGGAAVKDLLNKVLAAK